MKAISLQNALDTVEELEQKLSHFAKKHQTEIQNDPVFRDRFLKMCGPLGVDPLASKKSFWGQLLGMGDFYHELAVKVAEVCLAAKARNGGIMSLQEVQMILSKRRTKLGSVSMSNTSTTATAMNNSKTGHSQQQQQVSISDLQIAIQKLSKLGGGFRTIQVGKSIMVISVPTELDNDHMQIMTAASAYQDTGLTIDQVMYTTKWSKDRTQRAIDLLLQQGMAWIDTYQGENYYWFPSLWQEENC